jgi:hypothetical protein
MKQTITTRLGLTMLLAAALAVPAWAQTPPAKAASAAKATAKAGKDGEATYEMPTKSTGGKTREQVKKECAEARKAGQIKDGECSYDMPAKATVGKTREQVKKECAEARKAGQIKDGECQP